ncbi:MAG TPA: dihydroorotase [Spirochaetia bacterium]|nr:dihydroorotase [Spirochaetia bacterium]
MSERPREIVIRRPDDLHVHLRDGEAVSGYARDAARHFARILVMPNTSPPIVTTDDLVAYRARIEQAAPKLTPLMTFKIMQGATAESIRDLKSAGAVAGKLYPRGATTNSEDGLSDIGGALPIFEVMEEVGLVLCIHGENPAAPVLEREAAFLPTFFEIISRFPRLKVVLEHVSSEAGVQAVREAPERVAATITVHHLLFTLDDLLGNRLRPHLFCKPVIKPERDRAAIERVVLEGHPRFFYGSDSAPHLRSEKESDSGSAGVYSIPVSLSLLAEFFVDRGAVGRFEPFVSELGARFYGLPLNEGTITIRRESWRVPEELHGVVPLLAGTELDWLPA